MLRLIRKLFAAKVHIGLHPKFHRGIYWLNERGVAVLQIGWLIAEIEH